MIFGIHRSRGIFALLGCLFVAPAFSQTGPGAVSLRDAIAAALKHNPQLTAFEFRQQIVQAEHYTAGLKPAMAIDATVENIAGSGAYSGAGEGEFTLALSSVIELGGKRAARLGVTSERQETLSAQQRVTQLDLLAEVTRRFIAAVAAQHQLRLQQTSLDLSKETTLIIQKRVAAGITADAELARTKANQARMSIQLRQAELGFIAAKVTLAAMWGQTQADFTALQGDLFNLGATTQLNALMNDLANNPDLEVLASQTRLSEAEVRLAQSLQKNSLTWSAGVRRLQATEDSALVLGLSLPLSSAKRASGEVAAAKARHLEVANEHTTTLLNLRTQLFSLFQARQGAVFTLETLRDEVIPQLKNALNGTRTAFENGRFSYLELNVAQQELVQAQAALIDAAAQAQVLRAEIERLCGANSFQPTQEVTP